MDSNTDRSFFGKLNSHYEALAMVKDTSNAFFIIAALQLLSALLASSLIGLLDPSLNFAGALVLRRTNSRVAATLLLLLASIATLIFLLGYTDIQFSAHTGSMALIFALVGLWAGVRATEATFKLHGSLSSNASLQTSVDNDA